MEVIAYLKGNRNSCGRKTEYFGKAMGAKFVQRTDPRDCDLAIHWGAKLTSAMMHTIENNIPYIILENPVWGDRGSNFSWCYGGLNGLGHVPSAKGLPAKDKPELQEWKTEGEVTIFGQLAGDAALHGLNIHDWIEDCSRILPGSRIRQHPLMLDQNHVTQEPLAECFARTGLAVTYSSTVGAEAVIHGIPTIAVHKGSLAYPVSTHTLSDTPITPDRSEWLHELSYRHISFGTDVPVDYILGGYDDYRKVCEGPKEVQRDEQELGIDRSKELWCQTPSIP